MSSRFFELQKDETVAGRMRQFWGAYLGQILLGLFLLLGPFFFLLPLLSLGTLGIVLGASIFIVGIIYAVREIFCWHQTELVLTNQRLLVKEQNGLFENATWNFAWRQVKNLHSKILGLGGTLGKYGQLQVEIFGREGVLILLRLKNPEALREMMLQLQTEATKMDGKINLATDEDVVFFLEKIAEKVGREKLFWLVEKFKNNLK